MVEPVPPEPTSDDELDGLAAELEETGLLEEYTGDDRSTAYRLTAEGTAVGRMLAMDDEKAGTLLEAVLDDG